MSAWNSVVFLKTKKGWSDSAAFSKMKGVHKVWSTPGDLDWAVMLDSQHSSPEETASFVKGLRSHDWVTDTKTSWWQEIGAR